MANSLHVLLRESVAMTDLPQLQRGTDDDLRESAPTQAERDKATKNGDAFPDGSFPITTQKQADDAWGLRGQNENHSKASIVAHISKQVAKHGLKMPGGKNTRESVSLRVLIREANVTKTGTAYEATILREGPGNPEDRNAYTKEALRKAVQDGMFEGLQAYANHPTASEERDRPERDVRQLVGHFREARYMDGNPAHVRAKFMPITGPGYEWVTSLIESALNAPAGKPLIGISIDGYGHTPDQQTINGRTYHMVREVTHLGSADIVTRAGAGGMFHRRLQEAWRTTGPAERRPDTSKEAHMKPAEMQDSVKAAVAKLEEAAGLDEKQTEKADKLVTDAITQLRECATAELKKAVKIREVKVEVPVAASDEDKDQLAAELATTKVKLQEAEDAAANERRARKTAETKLEDVGKAQLASKVLRETDGLGEKTRRAWFDEIVECEDEQTMRKIVERKVGEREEQLAELRESFGVEGNPPRMPAGTTAASSGGGLLDRLGIDRDELAAA